MPIELAEEALVILRKFVEFIGIETKSEKSIWGARIQFLGLEGASPCPDNG